MEKQTIVFGADHAGLELKQYLMAHLDPEWRKMDVGTSDKISCDYPVYAQRLCKKVLELDCLGVLICGSGVGMSIAANRFRGIRAALCLNEYMARMSRMHNKANVLCLGERIVGTGLAVSILQSFLQADFEGGRHGKRLELLDAVQPEATGNPWENPP